MAGQAQQVLNGWREIAHYLGRATRTVQRWERDLGLPVHRPRGRDHSAVLAFPGELESWLHQTAMRSPNDSLTPPAARDGVRLAWVPPPPRIHL